ncbi:MAG: hypothetical protein JXO49_09505 [Deltaproteobacteria bacterium]|nr:hypothetical protein [Candidatus Anaeroferrophillus wilburensis]MBN2889567.1 hypothetical protein [Deltaproteobacteria bacterium]
MKAAILFTGTGPILILTTYDVLTDNDFITKLESKNIRKFIMYEVPINSCQQKYGNYYELVAQDLSEKNDMRVLDYIGSHIFLNFSFQEMGEPVLKHE